MKIILIIYGVFGIPKVSPIYGPVSWLMPNLDSGWLVGLPSLPAGLYQLTVWPGAAD